jgi:hypothetical protein
MEEGLLQRIVSLDIRVSLSSLAGMRHILTRDLEIEFKSSPYYIIEEQLGGPTQCDSK